MKKLIVLLLMFLPFAGVVNAQEVKIAFVNTQEIFMALPETKDAQQKIEQLNNDYKKELETMNGEYQKKYADFIEQQDSLTENIKIRRMQEVEDIRQRMDNLVQVAQQDVTKKQQELMAPIQQKMADAIRAVGTEQGYTYIVDPQILLYTGSNAIDATPLVKAKLGLQ